MRNPFSKKKEKAMELLTARQREQLLANGRATAAALKDGKDQPEHFPVVKLFNPVGAGTWLLSELDPDYPDIGFALCDLGMDCVELGNVSLAEFASIRLPFGMRIEADRHWTATHPLTVYAEAGRRAGWIVTDRASLDAAMAKGGDQ